MSTFTKQALAQTLKELMKTKPIAKITVTELVESCGVNRQTFYYHFQDIYDLLAWVYENEALAHIEDFRSIDTWQKGIRLIFDFIQTNHQLCLNTYRSMGREHLELFLNSNIHKLLEDVINEVDGAERLSEADKSFILDFYTYAFTGILLGWLQRGMKETPEEVVAPIIRLMEGEFHQTLEKFLHPS